MAIATVTPAVPATDGSGASSSVTSVGATRTIQVDGAFDGTLLLEGSDDGTNFIAVAVFRGPGIVTVLNASANVRVTRSGSTTGTPVVTVSGADVSAVPSVAIAAGTQTASSGTVILSNLNGVTFGMGGSATVTASVAAGATATGNLGAISAGTQSGSSGTVILSNANGLSFGMAGSLTVTGSFAAIKSVSAGTTRATNGEVVLSNLNGVSFGVDGQTVTASIATSLTNVNVSAGTTSNNLSALVLSNSNGVSFGLNGSTVTGSVAAGATATGNVGAISAGTQSGSSGTIVFSNLNGISFGMAGSLTVTGSIATSLTNVNLSAGTTSQNLSAFVFSNSNNVSFGLNGSTVTATATAAGPTINFFDNLDAVGGTITVMNSVGTQQGSLILFPLCPPTSPFPGNMTASTVLLDMTGSPTALQSSSHTYTINLAVYTFSGSTLSLLNSASTTVGSGADNGNISRLYMGARYVSFHSSVWSANPTFSQTHYVGAVNILSSQAAVDISWLGLRYFLDVQRSGTVGATATTGNSSQGWHPYVGLYSATTSAFPASIHISEIQKTGLASGANFAPHLQFNNQVGAF